MGKDGFGNWMGPEGAMVCWRSPCEDLLIPGWLSPAEAAALCELGNVSSWWRKCLFSLVFTHSYGLFISVLVDELLCVKPQLLPLMARAVPAWRLLLHQRKAKLPERKGSAGGEGFVLSQPSVCQHYSKSSESFQPYRWFPTHHILALEQDKVFFQVS